MHHGQYALAFVPFVFCEIIYFGGATRYIYVEFIILIYNPRICTPLVLYISNKHTLSLASLDYAVD